jgi:RNA polymerase sigma-70 factor (ECF subfamily)
LLRCGLNPHVPEDDTRPSRARQGDLDAFNALVLDYQTLVYNLCYRFLGQAQAAEDTTQETFLNAWRSISGFRGESFRPWFLRIAANLCRDELRRKARRPASSLDLALEAGMPEPEGSSVSPETTSINRDLRFRLEAALGQLPAEQRLAIVLCDVEGLDYAEIAQVMHTSLGTVKSRIARGRLRMRQLMAAEAELVPARFRQEV